MTEEFPGMAIEDLRHQYGAWRATYGDKEVLLKIDPRLIEQEEKRGIGLDAMVLGSARRAMRELA